MYVTSEYVDGRSRTVLIYPDEDPTKSLWLICRTEGPTITILYCVVHFIRKEMIYT